MADPEDEFEPLDKLLARVVADGLLSESEEEELREGIAREIRVGVKPDALTPVVRSALTFLTAVEAGSLSGPKQRRARARIVRELKSASAIVNRTQLASLAADRVGERTRRDAVEEIRAQALSFTRVSRAGVLTKAEENTARNVAVREIRSRASEEPRTQTPLTAREYLTVSDSFLAKLEAAAVTDKREEEATRKGLVRNIRADAKEGAKDLGTVTIGGSKVLVPNAANLRQANLISERTKKRMSDFKLSYLNPAQVEQLKADGSMDGLKVGEFVRHSRRSARHMREFLERIGELEPELEEEINAALLEMEDAKNDLLKLEIRSFTQMRERLIRSINGRERRSELIKEIDTFDLNRNIWNLSLLEHPKASVQQMLATSSNKMGTRVSETVSQVPKRAHVMVGIEPGAQKKMTSGSRTASIAWRLFSEEELDRMWAKLPGKQQAQGSWRGLGLNYNTPEWYVPVPPEIVDDLRPILSSRRAKALEEARAITSKAL